MGCEAHDEKAAEHDGRAIIERDEDDTSLAALTMEAEIARAYFRGATSR